MNLTVVFCFRVKSRRGGTPGTPLQPGSQTVAQTSTNTWLESRENSRTGMRRKRDWRDEVENLKLENELIFNYLLSLNLWLWKAFHHVYIFFVSSLCTIGGARSAWNWCQGSRDEFRTLSTQTDVGKDEDEEDEDEEVELMWSIVGAERVLLAWSREGGIEVWKAIRPSSLCVIGKEVLLCCTYVMGIDGQGCGDHLRHGCLAT